MPEFRSLFPAHTSPSVPQALVEGHHSCQGMVGRGVGRAIWSTASSGDPCLGNLWLLVHSQSRDD